MSRFKLPNSHSGSNSHPTQMEFSLQAEFLHTLECQRVVHVKKKTVLLIVCSLLLSGCGTGADVRGRWPAVASRRQLRRKHREAEEPASRTSRMRPAKTVSAGEAASKLAGWRALPRMRLRRGNPAAAADYAQRAVNAAPQDNKLWFLLGYTSRLAGRYQTSVEAYQHGLQTAPGNADGMSGLAQTYARMGRTDDAKRLLSQVIRANPNRTNDLLIARRARTCAPATRSRESTCCNGPKSQAAERARRADAGGGLPEVEAARPRQADARPGEEALARTTSRSSRRQPTTTARSTTTKPRSPR